MSNDAKPLEQCRSWHLGDGVVAVVWIPSPNRLTQKHINKLFRYVAALRMEASILWEDEPPRDDGGEVGT